jgi:hypothetical protein
MTVSYGPDLRQYDPMVGRWCTSDGWGVEIIVMTATPDRHDGEQFRISQHGFHVGYARTVAELEKWFDLAALEEALGSPDGAFTRPPPGTHRFCAARGHRGGNGGLNARPEPPFRGWETAPPGGGRHPARRHGCLLPVPALGKFLSPRSPGRAAA